MTLEAFLMADTQNMELLGRSPVEEIFVMCVFNATDIKTD
jgi:hypothetical protein